MKPATLALSVSMAALGGLALAAAPAALGPAPPSGASLPEGQCIIMRDMGNHTVVDKNTMLVATHGPRRGLYRFTMTNGCLMSAISSDPISIRQVGGGKICKPKDIALTARSGACNVDSIVKLTPQEVAALPRRLQP
jgi:hypothetical protein